MGSDTDNHESSDISDENSDEEDLIDEFGPEEFDGDYEIDD